MNSIVVAFTYSAEVFPLVFREAGMSIAVAVNLFGAGTICHQGISPEDFG